MRKSTTPKGVASSLTSLPRVGCVTLANPALSKVQPLRGNGTPRGLMEIGVGTDCTWMVDFVWGELRIDGILFVWNCVEKYDGSWVGAVPMCPPVSPCKGASIVQSPCTMRVFSQVKRRCADVRAGT